MRASIPETVRLVYRGWLVVCTLLVLAFPSKPQALRVAVTGQSGGTLTVPLNAAPRTLNPIFAADNASRTVTGLMMADLMHINAATLQVEPALALSVRHSRDGLHWTVKLRRGIRFSDGEPLTSADVLFSFQIYEDEKLGAPQRDLLVLNGKPIAVSAPDDYTITLQLPAPDAVGDRLFDSLWILPRHRLGQAYHAGHLADAWPLNTAPDQLAGLGPFVLSGYEPGQELRLARNRNYWKVDQTGHTLPYLDSVNLREVTDPNTRAALFARHELDVLDPVSVDDFARLSADPQLHLMDGGPALEPIALVFNLNQNTGDAALARRQSWFRQVAFRRAISEAIDRPNLVRSVFAGRAAVLTTLASPADKPWAEPATPAPPDPARAKRDLAAAGFRTNGDQLQDSGGTPIAFSLIVPSTNQARMRIATFLEEDMRQLGIAVQVVPLDFASFADRLLHRRDYDAALMAFGFPDADPNVESAIWTLDGGMHLWNLQPPQPQPWERELDRLFHEQLTEFQPKRRLEDYRQIQQIEREELPMIPLVTPHVLVGASAGLINTQPATLAPHLLWNISELACRKGRT